MWVAFTNKKWACSLVRYHPKFNFNTKKPDDDLIPFVRTKLKKLSQEYINLESKFHEEGGASHRKRREEFERLGKFSSMNERLESIYKNIEDLQKMGQEDPESKAFVEDQLVKSNDEIDEIKESFIDQLKEPAMYDEYDEIRIQLRPAVGGAESSLFVKDIADMYQNYIIGEGWSLNIMEEQKDSNVKDGLKFCSMKVVGQGCYRKMKCESGVHKVIRVPETESKGRIHSSTMSVVVVPFIPFDFVVNDKDIRYEFTRAQGAGGQHVNKTDSACRATHIPTGLAVLIQQHRVQDQNKRRATQILKQRLFQAQFQKNVQQESSRRKIQIGSGDRSQKIRTYNFPQDRITDHRMGLTLFGIQRMLAGEYVQTFINEYINKIDGLQRKEAINILKS